jgi:pyruvate, water dikinase
MLEAIDMVPTSIPEKTTDSQNAANEPYVIRLSEVGLADVSLVGGKNASLGEMLKHLTTEGIRIPDGFATTAFAYRRFIQTSGLEPKMRALLNSLDIGDVNELRRCGRQIRSLILNTPLPDEMVRGIEDVYGSMCKQYGSDVDVAIRSSATAEDLPDVSFAGQQETYLNIHGLPAVMEACRKCFASLFTDRAISYRQSHGFDHFEVALSVGVQKMVRSDLASSGVMFSIDTETGFEQAVLITAAYGLGENIVQGTVSTDEYVVFKPTLLAGYRPILEKRLGSKELKLIYDSGGSRATRNVSVPLIDREAFAISDDDILQLARWACRIEAYYSHLRGVPTPMDIEWAKDGLTGELFVVQARPETVQSHRERAVLKHYTLPSKSRI